MGLNVMVYTGPLEPYEIAGELIDEIYEEAYEAGAFRASNSNGFDRTAPLEPGVFYKAQNRYRFSAGPYSGYGMFRRWLCETFLGVGPEAVWADPQAFEGRPFFEQINFGDNEDTFGTEACRKLADDYDTHSYAVPHDDDLPHNLSAQYSKWRDAFKLAAETDGAVDFR